MDFSSISNLLNKILNPLVTFISGFLIGFLSGFFSRLAYDYYKQPYLTLNPSGYLSSKKDQWMNLSSTKHYLSVINTGRTAAVRCGAQITLNDNDIDPSMCIPKLNVPGGPPIVPHIVDPKATPIKDQGLCWASGQVGKLTLNRDSPENLEFCQHVLIFPTEMQSYNNPRVGLILERFKELNRPQINVSLTVSGENVRTPLKVDLTIKFVDNYKNIEVLDC